MKIKVSAVASAGENVLDTVSSFGKDSFEVFLWIRLFAAEGADVRSKGALHLAGEFAEAFLVEDEGITSLIHSINGCAESRVDLTSLAEELGNPGVSSGNSSVRSSGVVVHQIEESVHVAADLVQSLFSARNLQLEIYSIPVLSYF